MSARRVLAVLVGVALALSAGLNVQVLPIVLLKSVSRACT